MPTRGQITGKDREPLFSSNRALSRRDRWVKITRRLLIFPLGCQEFQITWHWWFVINECALSLHFCRKICHTSWGFPELVLLYFWNLFGRVPKKIFKIYKNEHFSSPPRCCFLSWLSVRPLVWASLAIPYSQINRSQDAYSTVISWAFLLSPSSLGQCNMLSMVSEQSNILGRRLHQRLHEVKKFSTQCCQPKIRQTVAHLPLKPRRQIKAHRDTCNWSFAKPRRTCFS